MSLYDRIYVWSCRALTGLAGAATLYVVWVLHATTMEPQRLWLQETVEGLSFASTVIAIGVALALAAAAAARLIPVCLTLVQRTRGAD